MWTQHRNRPSWTGAGAGPGVAGRARRPPPPTACPRALRLRPLPSAPQPRLLVLFLPNSAPASSVSPVPPPGPRTLQPGVTVLSLAPPAPLQPQVPPPGTPRFPATPNSWGWTNQLCCLLPLGLCTCRSLSRLWLQSNTHPPVRTWWGGCSPRPSEAAPGSVSGRDAPGSDDSPADKGPPSRTSRLSF